MSIFWTQLSIATTITAETVVTVINNRTNVTRTTTISNTEVDLSQYTIPNNTNSAGTITTSVVFSLRTTESTRYV